MDAPLGVVAALLGMFHQGFDLFAFVLARLARFVQFVVWSNCKGGESLYRSRSAAWGQFAWMQGGCENAFDIPNDALNGAVEVRRASK